MISLVQSNDNQTKSDYHPSTSREDRKRTQLSSSFKGHELVSINVCGMRFETLKSTLDRFPSTLLGDEHRRFQYYEKASDSYFFDRNRAVFDAVLFFYQSGGILYRPPNIPLKLFLDELAFYDLGEDVFRNLKLKEGIPATKNDLPRKYWQRKIWELFEYPESSPYAQFITCWSIFVIAASIVVFCIGTMPYFHPEVNGMTIHHSLNPQPWASLELGFIVWFTIEYILRLISAPDKREFFKSVLNSIDLMAILPFFVTILLDKSKSTYFEVLKVVRLIRVFRIFKLSRHIRGLQILGKTIIASAGELTMLMLSIAMGVILFSTGMYYTEQGGNHMFTSIPDAFWYSLVTMTTVGYGDKWPMSNLGKLVGSICVVSGVLTLALPIPVIVAKFEYYYKREKQMAKIDKG